MEIQLRELIDQIKKDGVQAAQEEAASIIDAAKAEAEKIVADAQARANKLLADAKAENERIVRSGEDALRQAGRNLLLAFRESVTKELRALIGENVNTVYSSDAFAKLILSAVAAWADKPDAEDLTVILSPADLAALEDTLLAGMKERMNRGVTLQANDRVDGGFRIAVNNSGAYYDYSAEAIVDMLSNYLSPKVTALLKEAE